MPRLDPPHEILELADGESVDLRIASWERGDIVIHPRYSGAPESKVIRALRVHVAPSVKATLPHYWDITSGTLIAGLIPYLARAGFETRVFRITARGVRPTKRFTLTVE